MNIFAIKGREECCKLDRTIFEDQTEKDKIYYREDGGHYAICPACKNPIKIINLYDNNRYETNTKRQASHGRHYIKDLPGLAKHDQDSYNNCPIANPKAFGLTTKRRDKRACNEIIKIIDNNKILLLKYIRNITGIYFSNSLFDKLLSYFTNAEGYDYEYINRFNLPYSFLYMQRKINIFNQWITYNSVGSEIKEAIGRKSKNYEVKDNRINKKKGTPYVELNVALFEHKIQKEGEETIQLRIYEDNSKDKKSVVIFKKTIKIDIGDFISEIK